MQRLLNEHGHRVAERLLRRRHRAARGRPQEAAGIEPDGTVGRLTWQQLAVPLRRGDSGDAVLAAEELLALLGAEVGADDRFTNETQQLIIDFQAANGLAVDGVVDIDTWRVMLALVDQLPPAAGPTPRPQPAPGATGTRDDGDDGDTHDLTVTRARGSATAGRRPW